MAARRGAASRVGTVVRGQGGPCRPPGPAGPCRARPTPVRDRPPLRLPDFLYRPLPRRLPAWAFVVSIALHAIAMWEWWPRMQPQQIAAQAATDPDAPLVARLERSADARPPQRPPEPQPAKQPPERPRRVAPPPRPAPPVIAVEPALEPRVQVPVVPPAPPPPPPPAATPPMPPLETDLAAYIEARRRERGAGVPPASTGTTRGPPSEEEERARRDRAIARNLAGINAAPGGEAPKNSGGIFQVRRLGYDDAEFTFFGWYQTANRRMTQKVEVRRGTNPDIRIAVVRRMIEIIRQYEQQDFEWQSIRFGRNVTLSARAADTEDLEAFLMREFFEIEPTLRRTVPR